MSAFSEWLDSLPRRGSWIAHCRFKPMTEVEAACLKRKEHREAERKIQK